MVAVWQGPLPNSFVSRVVCLGWGLISPSNDQCGEAQPEKGTFFTPQVYERVRISLVEVNEMVGRFVISVRNKAQKSWKMHYVCERVGARKLSGFLICSHLKVHLQQFEGIQSSKLGMWKGYHLSIEGRRKGYCWSDKCNNWPQM